MARRTIEIDEETCETLHTATIHVQQWFKDGDLSAAYKAAGDTLVRAWVASIKRDAEEECHNDRAQRFGRIVKVNPWSWHDYPYRGAVVRLSAHMHWTFVHNGCVDA